MKRPSAVARALVLRAGEAARARSVRLGCLGSLSLLLAGVPLSATGEEAPEAHLIVKEEVRIGSLPREVAAFIPLPGVSPTDLHLTGRPFETPWQRLVVFSPDGRRMAYRRRGEDGDRAFVGKSSSGPFTDVRGLAFSDDGEHFVYAACRRDRCFFVIDGKEQPPFDSVGPAFAMSRNGEHFVYGVTVGSVSRLVVDGTLGAESYDWIAAPIYSPDEKRLAVAVGRGNKEIVVVDGEEGPPYDRVGAFTFSPDGRRFAHWGGRGPGKSHRQFVVVDGEEGPPYWSVGNLVFSPDGRRFAYRVLKRRRGQKEFVAIDGVESPIYRCDVSLILDYGGGFSEGARRSNWLWPSIVFSADGERIAYAAPMGPQGSKFVVVDGKPSDDTYERLFGLTFSPDGKRLGYAAVTNGVVHTVVDGMALSTGISLSGPASIVKSLPSGVERPPTVVPAILTGDTLDLPPPREPGTVGAPVFSPDSRRFAYVRSRTSVGLEWWFGRKTGDLEIVVDGATTAAYDRIAALAWEGPTTLRAVGCRSGECFRVVWELESSGQPEPGS